MIGFRYYEWKQVDKREKQPYYFYKEGSTMKVLAQHFSCIENSIVITKRLIVQFAALYDTWKGESGEVMYSCTILTTSVAPKLSWIHTRMPVHSKPWLYNNSPHTNTLIQTLLCGQSGHFGR